MTFNIKIEWWPLMKSKMLAATGVKIVAFVITMSMVSSFGVEIMAIGIALGIAYAAYTCLPVAAREAGKRRRSGARAQLAMLGAGALAVCALALVLSALPGPSPVAGADDAAARAPATYKGVDYCRTCHGPGGLGGDFYTGWKTTNHGLDFTNRSYHGAGLNLFTNAGGNCQKCHVVGYNQTAIGGWDPSEAWNSTHNSALQGIQCENCHGPGSDHQGGATGIVKRPAPGQSCAGDTQSGCHGPAPGHMAVPAWNSSLHSPEDERAASDPPHYMNANCAKCHSPSQYDPSINSSNPAYNLSKTDFRGVECVDCHDMHNGTNERDLIRPVDETCTKCHTTDKTFVTPGKSPGHRTQKEIFLGLQGANVTGSKGMPGVTCADCHMWATPRPVYGYYLSDVPGYPYKFKQGHEFKATAESCADCHSDLMLSMPNFTMPANDIGANATAYAAWAKWLPLWENEVGVWQKVIDDWQSQVKPLLGSATENVTAAKAAIDSATINRTKDAATIARATGLWSDAYWNYKMVEADSNYGVHNYVFATDLLNDALSKAKQVLALITGNSAPSANAGPSRAVSSNSPVIFDGSASSDMDGTIASYHWDFGDGTNSTEMVATHAYASSGLYYVTLTVTDGLGAAASATVNVFVANRAPRASAGSDTAAEPGATVSFNGTGSTDSDGTLASYGWDFGDGTFGNGAVAAHIYRNAGAYAVILTVTDDEGAVGIDTVVVTVAEPPAPVDLGRVERNVTELKNDTAALRTDLNSTAGSIKSVQDDTAALKKDVADTKKSSDEAKNTAADTKKSVDALSGNIGLYMASVLVIAMVSLLVLYMVAAGRITAMQRQLDSLKDERKKDG